VTTTLDTAPRPPAERAEHGARSQPSRPIARRLTWLLFAGQSLATASFIAGATIGTIVGAQLSGQPALAGVPGALILLGGAAAAYPAARFMERRGRRVGLALGFACGVVGALIAGAAIVAHSFAIFLLGFTLMGVSRGFTDLGRYAAAEMHPEAGRARAISLVVLGGTVGALVGPALVGPTGQAAQSLGQDSLVGPWFAAAALYALGVVIIGLWLRPDPRDLGRQLNAQPGAAAALEGRVRSLAEILRQPGPQVAVSAMVLGQLVMVMIMAISSLHVYSLHPHAADHGLGDVSLVIMAHTLGMFGLSVVAGRLADNFGRGPTIVAGVGLLIAACLIAPLSTRTGPIALALFLLGLGWNFCYVAGAALLTDSLTPAERGRMQGSSDLLTGLVSAVGNLGSGAVFAAFGYTLMSWISLAVTLIPLAFAARLVMAQRRQRGIEDFVA
jgi:MFS family permease